MTRKASCAARGAAALLAAAVAIAAVTPARGERAGVEAALEIYDQGELDRALDAFEAALGAGGNRPEDLVTIHVHLGVLRGAGGDTEAARRSFETALALNPMLPAPSELGGQLRSLFEDLRSARSGRVLGVEVRPLSEDGASGRVEAAAVNAPPGLVASLRIEASGARGGAASWTRTLTGAGPSVVTVPDEAFAGAPLVSLSVAALDAQGNVLARADTELGRAAATEGPGPSAPPDEAVEAPASTPDADTATTPRRRWVWYRHPAFWVAIGLVVAGGVTAGVVVGTAEDRYVVGAPRVR